MNFATYATMHARQMPDEICLIERTPSKNQRRTLTWKKFNDEINKVANYLSKELKVKDGDFVMHLQNNSLEWLITYFGIIKIGAVVVPLNFRFIGPDILYAANICKPKVFFIGSEFLPLIQPIQANLSSIENYICVGEQIYSEMIDYQSIAGSNDTVEAMINVDAGHDLALMFTSGTAGDAKPILHTHYSMNNTAIGNGMSYTVGRNDNYVFFLPLYHSGTLFLWAPYYAIGATGTILKEFRDPKWIIEAIAEERGADVLFVVPIAVAVLNSISSGQLRLEDYDLSSWRNLEIGAQPVPFSIVKQLVETLPCGISNIYGITEGGGGGLFNLYPAESIHKPGSIGRPTFGVEGNIIDSEGEALPPGKVGELLIRTNRMMKNYYGNPEITRDIIRNGWLHTGDLVRTDEEGYYFIIDRARDLIICGGENVYPVEIEEALMTHPKINDVACIGYPDERMVEVVMAVIQLEDGESVMEDEVIEFAKSKLALYKVPRKVIFDQVHRSPSGKIMKSELRQKFTGRKEAFQPIDQQEFLSDLEFCKPSERTGYFLRQLENAEPDDRVDMLLDHLCDQARKVLGLDADMEIPVNQGLAEIGFDSIMAVELNNRLMDSLDCTLPSTLAFDYPTIEAILNYLKIKISGLTTQPKLKEKNEENDTLLKQKVETMTQLTEEYLEQELASELEKAGY